MKKKVLVITPHPDDETKTYTTTWFDMFRLEDGKITEHWDSAKIERQAIEKQPYPLDYEVIP